MRHRRAGADTYRSSRRPRWFDKALLRSCVAGAALLLTGCGGNNSPPPPNPFPTPPPGIWQVLYGSMPITLVGAGFTFEFPQDCAINPALGYKECKAGYITRGWGGPITEGKTFSMHYRIEATEGTLFRYDTKPDNTCGPGYPGIVGFYMQAATDPVNGRWYLKNEKANTLKAGEFDFSALVSTDVWTGVYPGSYGAAWSATLANVGAVGVVFGGGCFAAHGVNVSGGTARFTLDSYNIQ